MSIESVVQSKHLIHYCPLLLLLQSFLASRSFPVSLFFASGGQSFSISPSNAYLGLISFNIDWFDLLAVQKIHQSLLQHHNSKASIIQCSALYGPTLTSVHDLTVHSFDFWGRKWQPTPVFLPGESQGWGSLVGCHLWGRTKSDTTEAT